MRSKVRCAVELTQDPLTGFQKEMQVQQHIAWGGTTNLRLVEEPNSYNKWERHFFYLPRRVAMAPRLTPLSHLPPWRWVWWEHGERRLVLGCYDDNMEIWFTWLYRLDPVAHVEGGE